MKRTHLYLLLLLTAPAWCGLAAAGAQAPRPVPETDIQFWSDTQLAVPLGQKADFVIQGTVRIRANFDTAVDERWGAGFVFKLNKYLSLNPFYFHREARPPRGKPENEERLTMGATLRFPIKKQVSFIERNWIERRFRSPQVNAWRYRNRMQLEHPFKIKKAKFTGYVSDEVFYDWSLHDWVRNRFAIGANHAFNKHFTLDLYLMRQSDGRSRPGDITVLGSNLRFRM
jgi:hypothetical protein